MCAGLIGDPKQMCLALVDVDCEMRLRAEVYAEVARWHERRASRAEAAAPEPEAKPSWSRRLWRGTT